MKTLVVLLVLVGIATACSTDPVITNTTTINHNYYGQTRADSISLGLIAHP